MHLSQLPRQEPNYQWGFHNHIDGAESLNWHDQHEVCNHFSPYVKVEVPEVRVIHEATYKEIGQLIDGNFLNQKIRADELQGVFFAGFKPKNTMNFRVPSSKQSVNRINYTNSVMFEDWEQIGADPDFNFNERARMLLWVGNIRLHCTCPSFLYWGYQYMCTVIDASIYPEDRFPRIRNPNERGIVCKHLNRVLRVLPFHSAAIAGEIKSQFGA